MTKTPHKHAELIIAWANGEIIEFRAPGATEWVQSLGPAWVDDYEYRVKPARSYPETKMTREEATRLNAAIADMGHVSWAEDVIATVNAGLRHAIDNAQVVPMSEVQETARNLADQLFADQFTKPGQLIAVKQCKTCGGHQQIRMPLADRAARDLAVSMAVRDKCRDITVSYSMRSGVVHDIERLDLFAIIDAVKS